MSQHAHPHGTPADAPAKERLTGHAYDGIEEYDNPTPGWWTAIFIVTIVFAGLYWFVATLSSGGLSAETELKFDTIAETTRQFGSLGELKPDAATVIRFSHDEKWKSVGESIFLGKCAACHGRDGAGINGPNLTDDSYIHVSKVEDIVDVVMTGRNNGAMPAWRNTMSENEIIMVSAYVTALRGQNKPGRPIEANAKAIPPFAAE